MEMYWSGVGGGAVARHFGIPEGTVYSWIHDFGTQRERIESFTPFILMPFRQKIREAKTADEWLNALRENIPQSNTASNSPPVRLVCELINGQSGVNRLVTIISEGLHLDPLNGEVFAFCNKEQNIITTITWKKTMFNMTKFPKMNGSFIWPHKELGISIEVGI